MGFKNLQPAAGGGGGAAVSLALTPSTGTPSSVANGATVDAGMLNGWTVWNPSSWITALDDDGSTFDVSVNNGAANAESGTGLWTNSSIYFPTWLAGDFVAEMKYSGDTAGTNASFLALVAGRRGDASPRATFNSASAGHHMNTSAKTRWNSALSGGAGSTLYTVGTDSVAWATPQWMQIKRVGSTITVSRKTLDGDSWTEIDADDVDLCGARFRIHIMLRASTAKVWKLYALNLTATEAT